MRLNSFLMFMLFCHVVLSQSSLQERYGYERMWPTLKQPWYFDRPSDIAIDSQGHVYIGNDDSYTLKLFTTDGQFIRQWTFGSDIPRRVAVDGKDYVYVLYDNAELDTAFIRVFDDKEQLKYEWGRTYLDGIGRWTLAVDSAGLVYVTDADYTHIQQFSSDGIKLQDWALPARFDKAGKNQNEQLSVAVSQAGRVYLLYPNRLKLTETPEPTQYFVTMYDLSSGELQHWGQFGDGKGQFIKPRDIAVDKQGYVYVTDTFKAIQKFSSGGEFIEAYDLIRTENIIHNILNIYPRAMINTDILLTALEQGDGIESLSQNTIALALLAELRHMFNSLLSDDGQSTADISLLLNLLIAQSPTPAPDMEFSLNNLLLRQLIELIPTTNIESPMLKAILAHSSSSTANNQADLLSLLFDETSVPLTRTQSPLQSTFSEQDQLDQLLELAFGTELLIMDNLANGVEISLLNFIWLFLDTSSALWEFQPSKVINAIDKRFDEIITEPHPNLELLLFHLLNGNALLPNAIAINPADGSLYAVHNKDSTASIRLYSAMGELQDEWSSDVGVYKHNGQQLNFQAADIIYYTDETGQVYLLVSDFPNHRILKFKEDGTYVKSYGQLGAGEGQFSNPVSLAVNKNNILYVTDLINLRIQKFAIRQDELVYLSNAVESLDFRHLVYGSSETSYEIYIDLDAAGNVYVLDTIRNVVTQYNTEGEMGIQYGQFLDEDTASTLGDGHIYAHLAVDKEANVYIANAKAGHIEKYAPDGRLLGYYTSEFIEQPGHLAFDDAQHLYVYDNQHFFSKYRLGTDDFSHCVPNFPCTAELQALTRWGAEGNYPNQVSGANVMTVSPDGERVYVAELENRRIQVFRKNLFTAGKAIIIAGSYTDGENGDNLWAHTQIGANLAYRTLAFRGFRPEQIKYITAADNDFDLNQDGKQDNTEATSDEVKKAITEWAVDNWQSEVKNLTIYIADHGDPEHFYLTSEEGNIVKLNDLNEWVTEWQNQTGGIVKIIYDACYAGSLIDSLLYQDSTRTEKYSNRILITTAAADNKISGLPFSTDFFWGEVFNRNSLRDAYDRSATALSNVTGHYLRMENTTPYDNLYIGDTMQITNPERPTRLRDKAVILAAGSPQQLSYVNIAPKTRLAHKVLQQQGYNADDIRLFINKPVEDFGYRTFPADLTTIDTVLSNQDGWLQDNLQNFTLYIIGAGNEQGILLNTRETAYLSTETEQEWDILSFEALNAYIETIETDYMSGQYLLTMYEGYNAAYLLPELSSLKKNSTIPEVNRIVIAGHDEMPTIMTVENTLPNFEFSNIFWNQILQGNNVLAAFRTVENDYRIYTAMLDDTYDGLYDSNDGGKTELYYIGLGINFAKETPTKFHLSLSLPAPTVPAKLYAAIAPLDEYDVPIDNNWSLIVDHNKLKKYRDLDNLTAWQGAMPPYQMIEALNFNYEPDASYIRLSNIKLLKADKYQVLYIAVPLHETIHSILQYKPLDELILQLQ